MEPIEPLTSYALRSRPRTNDYDIVSETGDVVGQVIQSKAGFTVYMLGDYEALLQPYGTPEDALGAFEDWAASNTTDSILILPKTD